MKESLIWSGFVWGWPQRQENPKALLWFTAHRTQRTPCLPRTWILVKLNSKRHLKRYLQVKRLATASIVTARSRELAYG